MNISDLVLIALIGLALLGGTIHIRFKGLHRGKGKSELQAKVPTPTQKRLRGSIKKPTK
jgi:hypothetical protein